MNAATKSVLAYVRKSFVWALLPVLGATVASGQSSTIPFSDSFESYSNVIVAADGTGSNGWAGVASTGPVAVAVAATYIPVGGFPITNEAHTQVLQFEGTISNAFDTTVYGDTNNLQHYVWVDCMLRPGQVNFEPTMDNDVQVGAYIDTNGHLRIWHAYYYGNFANCDTTWSTLDNTPIASDQWVRVTLTMDYLSAATNPLSGGEDWSLNEHYFQVRINGGAPLTNSLAFTSPTPQSEADYGGSYFLCADSGFGNPHGGPNHRYFSNVGLQGVGMADDVVVSTQVTFGVAYDITVSAGPGGTISPPGPTVRVSEGDDQAFTIAANPNFAIADVLIDSVSIGITNAYTFMNVMSNHSIAATFNSTQSPLDVWLAEFGLSDPNGDADNDGLSNAQEYYAGTNPTNAASVFRIFRQQTGGGSNTVQWFATTNNGPSNGFLIYRSTNLLGNWTLYGTNIDRSPNGTNVWTDLTPPARGPVYYQPRIPTNNP
jgi:hypothetical protein